MGSHTHGDDKFSLSAEEIEAGIMPEPATKKFVAAMILVYAEAARLQYEEAERLMSIALAAKEHADAMLDRAADLVAENLGPDGEWAHKDPPPDEDDDIPW
jgi:hypothetical protein